MADDRLWMRCLKCGDLKLLFKFYAYGHGYAWPTRDELDEWISKHLDLCYKHGVELPKRTGFDLVSDDARTRTRPIYAEER